MGFDRCLFVSGFDVQPEHETDFERWYAGVHVPEALELPGFLSAHRYVRAGDYENTLGPKFLNIYEVESQGAFEAGWETSARRASSADFNRWAGMLSNGHVGLYRPHEPGGDA